MITYTHRRPVWVPPAPAITGPPITWATIDTASIHYTAATTIPDDEAGFLRNTQRSYVANRGYSIGYNAAVSQDGTTWELRGHDIKCAANKGHNDRTWAILVLVDGADPATPQAAAAIRGLIGQAELMAGRKLRIVGHGQLEGAATACPGVGLRAQISAGVFTPTAPPPPPSTPDTEDDDDMRLYRKQGKLAVWLAGGGRRSHVADERTLANFVPHLGPVILLDESVNLNTLGVVVGVDPGDI